MSLEDEFAVIDMVAASIYETRGVDAFSLAVIKAERQARKLFTNMVFQYPCFTDDSVSPMRSMLGEKRSCYFDGFLLGIDEVSPRSVSEMIGVEYEELREKLTVVISVRNKIFHGQLTERRLGREDLLAYVGDIKRWCSALATGGRRTVGYDGFLRNSFQKGMPGLSENYRIQLNDLAGYDDFLKNVVCRPRR